jgi:hypothetical protein
MKPVEWFFMGFNTAMLIVALAMAFGHLLI